MAGLEFQIKGVEAACRGLVPALQFHVGITCLSPDEEVELAMLRVQIQFAAPQRRYSEPETQRLVELFGQPSQWSRTLRNGHWTQVTIATGPFTGALETTLSVPCSFDLNVTSTQYFHSLETGDIPLTFHFRGTVLAPDSKGELQVRQIPRDTTCAYRMPLRVWQRVMDEHFPNTGWLFLRRDVLDRLFAYRRSRGLTSWEETVEWLLAANTGQTTSKPQQWSSANAPVARS